MIGGIIVGFTIEQQDGLCVNEVLGYCEAVMELLDIEEDELGDVEFLAQEKKEIKKKHQAEYVNNFHYSHLEEGVLQDLDSYVRWHKEHPGTTTPRKAR